MQFLDANSLKLQAVTVLGWIGTSITKSDILFFITLISGGTAIVLNLIKIRKEIKHKK